MGFKVGDKIYHERYGKGVCYKIDEKDFDYTYDFHFNDGSRMWMSKKQAEKEVVIEEK